jgi:hypothetical protein
MSWTRLPMGLATGLVLGGFATWMLALHALTRK